jgi:hypothetical protein
MANQRDVVVGVFRTRLAAQDALEALRHAGFAGQRVSLLTENPDQTLPPQQPADPTAAATTGAVAGSLLGGIAGWLAGAGALLIPGVGPFIATGAFAAALTGAALGAGLGAISGALATMGVPEEEARWYEQQVRGGGTLVTVDAGTRASEALEILRRHGAYDVETEDPDRIGYGVAGGPDTK